MQKTKTMRPSLFIILPFILAPGFALAQTAERSDGWVSHSAHIQGTCSGHGGVEVWLNREMKRQANEWCDTNPDLCAPSHWRGIGGHGIHCDRHFPWIAANEILVNAYEFTAGSGVPAALNRAHARGVDVRLVADRRAPCDLQEGVDARSPRQAFRAKPRPLRLLVPRANEPGR
jgi:hypothetical protein